LLSCESKAVGAPFAIHLNFNLPALVHCGNILSEFYRMSRESLL
jgi:hypothetical protein